MPEKIIKRPIEDHMPDEFVIETGDKSKEKRKHEEPQKSKKASMKITIEKNKLDNRIWQGAITLEGEAVAHFPASDDGNPSYLIIVDTREYDDLWREVTKDLNGTDDWGKELEEVYQQHPELREKLSAEGQYKVPTDALEIEHVKGGGGHGDLCLVYKDSTIVFMPLKEYNSYFSTQREILSLCDVFVVKGDFRKGDVSLLQEYGVSIEA